MWRQKEKPLSPIVLRGKALGIKRGNTTISLELPTTINHHYTLADIDSFRNGNFCRKSIGRDSLSMANYSQHYSLQRSKTQSSLLSKTGDFRNAVTSQNMTASELSRFRTQICPKKSVDDKCELEERCPFSHCLSWHRRTPELTGYRPTLCPNVIFSIGHDRKMRVKNYCKRGRLCLFSHTKEEQMYHPLVYKTQLCRDFPGCTKHFCPFAHGQEQLRDLDLIRFDVVEGPEKPEPETQKRAQWNGNLRRPSKTPTHQQHHLLSPSDLSQDDNGGAKQCFGDTKSQGTKVSWETESLVSTVGSQSLNDQWSQQPSNKSDSLETTNSVDRSWRYTDSERHPEHYTSYQHHNPNFSSYNTSSVPMNKHTSMIPEDSLWRQQTEEIINFDDGEQCVRMTLDQSVKNSSKTNCLTHQKLANSEPFDIMRSRSGFHLVHGSLDDARPYVNLQKVGRAESETPSTRGTGIELSNTDIDLSQQEIGELADQLSCLDATSCHSQVNKSPSTANTNSTAADDFQDLVIAMLLSSMGQQSSSTKKAVFPSDYHKKHAGQLQDRHGERQLDNCNRMNTSGAHWMSCYNQDQKVDVFVPSQGFEPMQDVLSTSGYSLQRILKNLECFEQSAANNYEYNSNTIDVTGSPSYPKIKQQQPHEITKSQLGSTRVGGCCSSDICSNKSILNLPVNQARTTDAYYHYNTMFNQHLPPNRQRHFCNVDAVSYENNHDNELTLGMGSNNKNEINEGRHLVVPCTLETISETVRSYDIQENHSLNAKQDWKEFHPPSVNFNEQPTSNDQQKSKQDTTWPKLFASMSAMTLVTDCSNSTTGSLSPERLTEYPSSTSSSLYYPNCNNYHSSISNDPNQYWVQQQLQQLQQLQQFQDSYHQGADYPHSDYHQGSSASSTYYHDNRNYDIINGKKNHLHSGNAIYNPSPSYSSYHDHGSCYHHHQVPTLQQEFEFSSHSHSDRNSPTTFPWNPFSSNDSASSNGSQ